MRTERLAFLNRRRLERVEAAAKASRAHRGQRQASADVLRATTRLLAAELRRDRPRHAGRFTPAEPAAGPDLFAGA